MSDEQEQIDRVTELAWDVYSDAECLEVVVHSHIAKVRTNYTKREGGYASWCDRLIVSHPERALDGLEAALTVLVGETSLQALEREGLPRTMPASVSRFHRLDSALERLAVAWTERADQAVHTGQMSGVMRAGAIRACIAELRAICASCHE